MSVTSVCPKASKSVCQCLLVRVVVKGIACEFAPYPRDALCFSAVSLQSKEAQTSVKSAYISVITRLTLDFSLCLSAVSRPTVTSRQRIGLQSFK